MFSSLLVSTGLLVELGVVYEQAGGAIAVIDLGATGSG